ncbi:hypothetical protein TUBRATIS_28610 [Tubulinosema ratisbonensis]|uniref:SWIM-type domain-containing protein n=1 Tax=Tubulinosema ratisbonensis TaxID=291195 RepID=A0A437AI33_9MICR|nr:hypothetical protein TUBRATIS_28610 [Tubulinosema ratisbonensis]
MKDLENLCKTLEQVFLICGDFSFEVLSYESFITSYEEVFYFVVNNYEIIELNGKYFCACNEEFCFHLVHLFYNKNNLKYKPKELK